MLTSENGLELIRKSEPLELVVYLCPAGKWTIGYGHTGPEVNKGMKIDIFDAIIMLRNDVKKAESAIAELVKVGADEALQLLTEVIAASDKNTLTATDVTQIISMASDIPAAIKTALKIASVPATSQPVVQPIPVPVQPAVAMVPGI